MGKSRKWIIGLAIILFMSLVALEALRRPGPGDLKGGFEEIAFVRNEQNKGGILRIYAFVVADTTNADYIGCGDLMPHNEYGSETKVYFFAAGTPAPKSLQLERPHFDSLRFQPMALYVKGEDGVGRLTTLGQGDN